MGMPRADFEIASRRTIRAAKVLGVPAIACLAALPCGRHDLRTLAAGFGLRVHVAIADTAAVFCDAVCPAVCLPADGAEHAEITSACPTRCFTAIIDRNHEVRLGRFGGLHGP